MRPRGRTAQCVRGTMRNDDGAPFYAAAAAAAAAAVAPVGFSSGGGVISRVDMRS